MARIFRLEGLEARKQALVAQSEGYRETLGRDLQDLRHATEELRHKFALFSSLAPLIAAGLPLAGAMLKGKPRRPWLRLAMGMVFKWVARRQVVPLLQRLIVGWRSRPHASPSAPQSGAHGAEPSPRS